MTRVLRVTDGTDTIDFSSPTSGYALLNHTPAVARRDPNDPEMYTKVVEELEISVSGDSRAQIVARVNLLTELIDRAQRLWRGENIDPVIFEYQVEGSTLGAPLEALVTGPPAGQSSVVLPALYDSAFTAETVGSQGDPLVWRFERRGALLGEEENQSDTGHAIGATVHTVSFASAVTLPSPLRARWGGISTFASGDIPRGFIIFSGGELLAVEAESVGGTGFTVEDESANFASGNSVIRSNGSSGTVQFVSQLTDEMREANRVAVFIVAKCSAGAEFEINIAGYGTGTVGVEPVRSRPIAFSGTIPTALALGSIPNANLYFGRIHVEFERLSASGTLDIDYVVLAAADHPAFSSILFTADAVWGFGGGGAFLEIDHKLLERPNAQVFRISSLITNQRLTQPYRGNAYMPTFGADVNYVLALVGGEDETHWRYGTNLAADSWDVNFWRRLAYQVPL